MDEIIIWGAGKAAAKKYEWAVFSGYQVIFYVDNDAKKWGKTIQGIPIYSPELLKGYKYPVMIPELYGEEIGIQLDGMFYQGRRIKFEQLKKEKVCGKDTGIDLSNIEIGNETSFLFDSYFTGLNWGGVESWSCMVVNQLFELNVETQLMCGPNKKFDKCVERCVHFSNENELDTIKEMAVKIAAVLPCVFITHGSIALYAAQIVKSKFPDQIKLVAVAHGDEINTYERLRLWSDRIDKIICISKKIQAEFQDRYKIRKDLLVYRPNPIKIPPLMGKKINYSVTLRIGYAARLRIEQKRVHLLPEIIETCMKKNMDVEFDIAGEGECLELLQAYVSDNHLENRVHILGWIPPAEMADFWGKEDIYLNISDFEGMSLAMLEAMACGAVPVVTDVSGVNDFIEDGKNGFVVSVDSWKETADKIEILSRNKKMLQRASDYNISLIRKRCDVLDYAKWLKNMFCFDKK